MKFASIIRAALKEISNPSPPTFIDPTGVEMRYSRYDCMICSAPGMECVDSDRCCRSNTPEAKRWMDNGGPLGNHYVEAV